MKKTLIIIGFLFFAFPALAEAQILENNAEISAAGTSTSGITFDYRYTALLEFFVQKTFEKDFQIAYNLTSGNFQKNNSLAQFTKIITAAGLTDFTAKKWIEFKDQMADIGVTTVKGEFVTPDGVTHVITLYVVIGGETEIKIGAITEDITIELLTKRLPQAEILHKLVLSDLKKVTTFIRKNQTKNAYGYLSQSAHGRTKLKDITKAFRAFRKKKLTIVLPKKKLITLTADSPAISQEGMMIVQGTYANSKNLVTFVLGYDYEWEWKLGLFSINAVPLSSVAPGTSTSSQ